MHKHAAEVSLASGAVLCAVSFALERNRHHVLWQYTEWLLLFYWLLFVVTLVAAAAFAFDRSPETGGARPFRIAAGAYTAFTAPIVWRAAWILWNFHGNTGKAEGMGWVALTYPAVLALSFATGIVYIGQLGRGGVTAPLRALGSVVLGVQLLPHVALYLAFLPPLGPPAPEPLLAISRPMVARVWIADYATAVQLALQLAIMAKRPRRAAKGRIV